MRQSGGGFCANIHKRKNNRIANGSWGRLCIGRNAGEKLNCSRAAVWKHMEELRKEGFELEAVRKKATGLKERATK